MDRTSSVQVGFFVLSVDRDHKGGFRGGQAMAENYRGWHYHVEHPLLSQEEIFVYLSGALAKMGACLSTEKTFIGVVEATPKLSECWRLGDKSTVLWISGRTGGLHIEANKRGTHASNILTKRKLVILLKLFGTKGGK